MASKARIPPWPRAFPTGEELARNATICFLSDYVGAVAHVAVDTDAAQRLLLALLKTRFDRAWCTGTNHSTAIQLACRGSLHHQLYAELAERRGAGHESFGVQGLHPLRSDPFRDFAPFATGCLRPDTELRLAMPFPELHHRLNNLTSLDRCYEQLHAGPLDLQRLLALLHSDGPCSLDRLLSSAC